MRAWESSAVPNTDYRSVTDEKATPGRGSRGKFATDPKPEVHPPAPIDIPYLEAYRVAGFTQQRNSETHKDSGKGVVIYT